VIQNGKHEKGNGLSSGTAAKRGAHLLHARKRCSPGVEEQSDEGRVKRVKSFVALGTLKALPHHQVGLWRPRAAGRWMESDKA